MSSELDALWATAPAPYRKQHASRVKAMSTIEQTMDAYREKEAERDRMRAALEAIAGWKSVNISNEPESELRKIIESIVGCAVAAIDD